MGVYLLNEYKKSKSAINITNWRRKISCYEYSFLEFLALKIIFFYKLLMKWRKPVFLKEIKMAKITSEAKVFEKVSESDLQNYSQNASKFASE